MPHAEIKYSDNLEIDVQKAFSLIEDIINDFDSNTGECKCRAYPSPQFKYPHVLITIAMLTKPYRDEAFTAELMQALENGLKALLTQSCYFSLQIDYSLTSYITNMHVVDGDELVRYQPPDA